jgi:O-antigen/teichoic acid export membrane protein
LRIDAIFPAGWLGALVHRFRHGRVLQAASLSTAAQLASHVIRLGGNLIMTRLLAPEMFGLMSVVLMVQVTLSLLSDLGLRTAVIQSRRGDDPVFLNTVWSIQIARGFIIFVATCALAYALAVAVRYGVFAPDTAWGEPELPYVLAAAGFTTFVGGFQSTNYITAGRNLQVGRVILIDGASQIGGLLMMIVLGYLMRSVWALVVAGLFSAVLSSGLSFFLPGIANRFSWDAEARKEIYKFGIWVLVSSATFVLASSIDRALLGALISAATLGLYSIALNLSSVIDGLGTRLFDTIVLPVLGEGARTSPEELRRQLMRIRLPFDLWYLGAAGFLFAIGPGLIRLLYDPRYEGAGVMLQLLSLSLIFTRYTLFNMAYLAVGRPKYLAILNLVKLVAVAVLLPALFALYGLTGAILAIAMHPVALLPFYYLFNRELGLNALGYELAVLPAWPAGYLAGLVLVEAVTWAVG